MILSSKSLISLLDSGDLVIEPRPRDEDFDSDSVEVHLGDNVYTWEKQTRGSVVTVALWTTADSSAGEKFDYKAFSEKHLKRVEPDPDGIITMRPQTFYLADLRQYTKLPPDVAMQIQGKSSLARLGVQIHLTAPHAHAGWDGTLTLEICNSGPFNIELKPGIPIGQLTFWRVEDPLEPHEIPAGQFSGQRTASGKSLPSR